MKTIFTLFIFAAGLVILPAFMNFKDSPFLVRLKEKIRRYHADYPEEKVYVQTDKPFYKPGEIIWFNTFLLNSNSHQSSSISDVVYVELIDPKGNVAAKADLVVNEGTANGDFLLPDNAPGGIYRIRAYTLWMKNFSAEAQFVKVLQVQRIITPRLLLKLDFQKESYGPGDYAVARLNVTNLKNENLAQTNFDFSVSLSGQKVLNASGVTEWDGSALIKFQLPDTISRPDGLFNVIVRSNGVAESISRSVPIVLDKITVSFFPEGGQYVTNVQSRIAFKALNEFGKGADIEGVVVDQSNEIVTRFESLHMGMGSFTFNPKEGVKYFARIEKPAGNTSLIELPGHRNDEYALNFKSKSKSLIQWNIYAPNRGIVYMVGTTHGEIVYAEKIPVKEGSNEVAIPTDQFPSGITVFTLFDQFNQPRCERLAFLNGDKGIKIELTTNKEKYNPGEAVDLNIKTTDFSGKPVSSKISLSVVDDKIVSFADDKQDHLLSAMLLSSEIKGEIQEPSFYFDPNEPKAESALDNLLMTQGWRRFSWAEVIDDKKSITYTPEKIKNIGGRVVNTKAGNQADVTLVELAGSKRILQVRTTKDGHFIIRNINPKIPYLLLTKKPGEIILQKNSEFSVSLNDKERSVLMPDAIGYNEGIKNEIQNARTEPSESSLDLDLSNDITALSEIVVTGYGYQESSNLSGSSVKIYSENDDTIFSSPALENSLQGRVAGLIVQPQTGNPGAQANLIIRGTSSLASGGRDPLYVLDGHPIGTSLSRNFSNGSMIGPEEIQSIEVITTPEMTALFGSQASNGVILITTKSKIGYLPFASVRKAAKYSSHIITPRKFAETRQFYTPPISKSDREIRKDFRTTIYWNHTIVTDDKGNARVSFRNNDAVSAYRITAEGFSASGLLGRNEKVYVTGLPLSLDAKVPEYLGYEDVLKLPVTVKNETSVLQSGTLRINIPDGLGVSESLTQKFSVSPHQTQTILYTIQPKGITGEFPVSLVLEAKDFSDQMNEVIKVRPIGFPVRVSFSAKELDKVQTLSIRNAEKNSITAELTAFPDILNDLFSGAESILQQPYGCFEQVSSSTFPNILALQYLKQSGMVNDRTEKKAMSFIEDGYRRLVAYEIKGGGFEWFGHPPGHEGLTAYGLLQFNEMKKVYNGVSDDMLERTRKWLLNKRDGSGGFKQNAGKYGFSGASNHVTKAYITYALSETGEKDVIREYDMAYSEALRSDDMYRMALVANTAYNLGKKADYENLIRIFSKKVKASGFESLTSEHSIVRSYGKSLKIETVSLWAVALMKYETTRDLELINLCIEQILRGRSYGEFGSTQGTALALKALTEYANIVRTAKEGGELTILVDNRIAGQKNYQKDAREKIVLKDFAKELSTDGDQELRILFKNTSVPLPYSVDVQWYTKLPFADKQCKVSIATSLGEDSVRMNETARLSATVTNQTNEGLPMAIAIIGIPAGLSVQPWQLKELQDKHVFDFYEIQHGNLVIYYRELAPSVHSTVHLDLKAEVPGTYTGTASSAYLYYTNEHKDWVRGSSITIQ